MANRLETFVDGGYTLPDGRRGGKCWGERPRCVNPHRLIARDPILAEGVIRCQSPTGRNGARCDVLLYVMRYVPASHPDENCWEVVEITMDHVQKLQTRMLHLERMKFLGLALPGVEFDIPPEDE